MVPEAQTYESGGFMTCHAQLQPTSVPDPAKLYGELQPLRHVRRFQQWPTLSPMSVMEHSYNVAMLVGAYANAFPLTLGRRPVLVEAALWHDTAELYTGDLPHPVKWAFPSVRAEWERIEDAVIRHLETLAGYSSPRLTDLEKLILKLADSVELILFVSQEELLGNRTITPAAERIWEYLRTTLTEKFAAVGYGERFSEQYRNLFNATLPENVEKAHRDRLAFRCTEWTGTAAP